MANWTVENSVVLGSIYQISDVHGNVSVGNAERTIYRINDAYTTVPPLARKTAWEQPSKLLQAHNELVKFTGRAASMDRLRQWRDELQRFSVLLVHAPGGQGKTRLAQNFARQSVLANWSVYVARHGTDVTSDYPESQSRLPSSNSAHQQTVLIVDYAERWPALDLQMLVTHSSLQPSRKFRVLLISRSTGRWWQQFSYEIGRSLSVTPDTIPLAPLADEVSTEELFARARDSFAFALAAGDVDHLTIPPGFGTEPESRQILSIHMAALSAVLSFKDESTSQTSAPVPPVPHEKSRTQSATMAQISADLIKREYFSWEKLCMAGQTEINSRAMAQAVYVATLTGALPYKEAIAVIYQADIGTKAHPDQIVADHGVAYPSVNDVTKLEPLHPDRLGEDFIALMTPGCALPGLYSPDPAVKEITERLLIPEAHGERGFLKGCRRPLTMLIEAAARWPHLAKGPLRVFAGRPA